MVFFYALAGLLLVEAVTFLAMPLLEKFTRKHKNMFIGQRYDVYRAMTVEQHREVAVRLKRTSRVAALVFTLLAVVAFALSLLPSAQEFFGGLSTNVMVIIIMVFLCVPLTFFAHTLNRQTAGVVNSKGDSFAGATCEKKSDEPKG